MAQQEATFGADALELSVEEFLARSLRLRFPNLATVIDRLQDEVTDLFCDTVDDLRALDSVAVDGCCFGACGGGDGGDDDQTKAQAAGLRKSLLKHLGAKNTPWVPPAPPAAAAEGTPVERKEGRSRTEIAHRECVRHFNDTILEETSYTAELKQRLESRALPYSAANPMPETVLLLCANDIADELVKEFTPYPDIALCGITERFAITLFDEVVPRDKRVALSEPPHPPPAAARTPATRARHESCPPSRAPRALPFGPHPKHPSPQGSPPSPPLQPSPCAPHLTLLWQRATATPPPWALPDRRNAQGDDQEGQLLPRGVRAQQGEREEPVAPPDVRRQGGLPSLRVRASAHGGASNIALPALAG